MAGVCGYPDCGGACLECNPKEYRRSVADAMDKLRSEIEQSNAKILESARQAEFYNRVTADEVRKLDEYRQRLSALTQQSYKAI